MLQRPPLLVNNWMAQKWRSGTCTDPGIVHAPAERSVSHHSGACKKKKKTKKKKKKDINEFEALVTQCVPAILHASMCVITQAATRRRRLPPGR